MTRGVQTGLARLGYRPGPQDGVLGPRTRSAIRAFEADHGLEVTGAVYKTLYEDLLMERARMVLDAE